MTVEELIEVLQTYPTDARVLIPDEKDGWIEVEYVAEDAEDPQSLQIW